MNPHATSAIRSLPTAGKRTVNLGYKHMLKDDAGGGDWFERDGLLRLGAQSHMRNNLRLAQHGLPLNPGEPPEFRCTACQERFGDLYAYTRQNDAPMYRGVKIETIDRQHVRYFCWECAGTRDSLIDALRQPHWQAYISRVDRDDVFGFIEQVVFENQLADEFDIDWLQCHTRSKRRIPREYKHVIGGKLLSLCDSGEYVGPTRPPTSHNSLVADPSLVMFINSAKRNLDHTCAFNPDSVEDARDRQVTAIVRRQGQPEFRRRLIAAYGGRCAISGCDAVDALEAAHIVPYRGPETNHPSNGILLRADLHTLFDLGLLGIDPATMTVILARDLSNTTYREFNGVHIRPPVHSESAPSVEALSQRLQSVQRTQPPYQSSGGSSRPT